MIPALAVDKQIPFVTGTNYFVPFVILQYIYMLVKPLIRIAKKFLLCCNTFLWHSYDVKAI